MKITPESLLELRDRQIRGELDLSRCHHATHDLDDVVALEIAKPGRPPMFYLCCAVCAKRALVVLRRQAP